MRRLILVHGVGRVRDTEADRVAWMNALHEGARLAGHAMAAQEVFANTESIFVNYSDLFEKVAAQGYHDSLNLEASPQLQEYCIGLLRDIIDMQIELPQTEQVAQLLEIAKIRLSSEGTPQGSGQLLRMLINAATTFARIPPFRSGAQWITGTSFLGILSQVGRYLSRLEQDSNNLSLDSRIRSRLLEVLPEEDEPIVVVAHSLGTIVALEALLEFRSRIDLFVTLGSPLAMNSIVLPRLVRHPVTAPECVSRWLNFWDRDDIVAARPILERSIGCNSFGVRPKSRRIDSDGVWVHTATKYLRQAQVAGPIVEALQLPRRANPEPRVQIGAKE